MPKKSAQSKSKDEPLLPRLKVTIYVLRALAILLLVAVVILLMSLWIEIQFFELYVSYLPQLLLVGAAVHLLAATLATRIVLVHDFSTAIKRLGIVFSSMYAIASILAVVAGSISVTNFSPSVFSESPEDATQIKVGTFNAHYISNDFAVDAGVIFAEGVDVLALQEVDESDVSYIQKLLGYEYSYVTNCDCSAGDTEVALVSKYPITRADTLYEDENSTILRSEVARTDEYKVSVYNVHMYVPYIASAYSERSQAYSLLSDSVSNDPYETIVMGDFNTTIFSPQLRRFSDDNKLSIHDVTERFWPRCSWFGVTDAGCLRIDHVFSPTSYQLHSVKILPTKESDHKPVVVELSLPTSLDLQLQ